MRVDPSFVCCRGRSAFTGWPDLPTMGTVSSRSWLSIVGDPGPSCSKPDYANPGLVEILIAINLPLKLNYHKMKV